MKALRKVFRPRWLLVLVLAAAVVPAALVTSGGATAGQSVAVNTAHPVVDPNWIYAEDWFSSTNYIYRVAGSDGPLTSPPGLDNLPQNYNGAQEYYAWYKSEMTNHDSKKMGPLGRFMTARDLLFNTRTWQGNDAEITIPGATCAGQQVMLASHNDSTPVTTGPQSGAVSGSATPMSAMHSGNWGNGSGYDAAMGEAMSMGEFKAVLAWHLANGTYPARTIKDTLYDNEEGGLVGSGVYSATGTPATTLTLAAAVGDTNIKVVSNSNLTVVGAPVAIDETAGNTENGVIQSSGTGQATTTLVLPTAVGDTNMKVASVATNAASGWAVGQLVNVDTGANFEQKTIQTVGTAARTATTLAAASAVGATNIKVTAINSGGGNPTPFFVVGEPVTVDTGAALETSTVAAIGTAGAAGTGITLATPLAAAHASGAAVRDVGTGVTVTTPLAFAHASGITLAELGAGITLTAPLTHAHPIGTTMNGPATGLLTDGPQGQIIAVLNNDQLGLDYPAPKWGTDHYLNNIVGGGVGPWFTNINASPVSPAANGIYGTVGILRLQHNLPAVVAFRANVADAVARAFADLGQKYNFSVPLESPLRLDQVGSTPVNPIVQTRPAYSPGDQAIYSPVLDDQTGRTDQVSFGVRGIPSLGAIGQYDSSTNPIVGGAENPYPAAYPSKPTLSGMFGQDSNSDYFSNLNFWASGTVHGPGGYDTASEGLLRGIETVATWFSYAVAADTGGGKVTMPTRPIAYFEVTPRKPTAQTTMKFDSGFSRTPQGKTADLKYIWDFGDGSPLVYTQSPTLQHTFPTQAAWRDVKLAVNYGGKWGFFRQNVAVDFFPTYYPAVAPATEPLPPSTGPAADPCGTLSSAEQQTLIDAGTKLIHGQPVAFARKD